MLCTKYHFSVSAATTATNKKDGSRRGVLKRMEATAEAAEADDGLRLGEEGEQFVKHSLHKMPFLKRILR